jgi:hypothetical protein
MHSEPTTNRGGPRKVPLVIPQRQKRKTPLARRRRLNALIRELAADLGFSPDAVTLSERGSLHQAATLLLQVELAQDQLVGGAALDSDTVIRLSSEARRLLAGLRSRGASQATETPPWSPLRSSLAKATSEPVDG